MVRSLTIITGASRGLGLSLAQALSNEGMVLALARSPKPAQFENNPNIIYESIDLREKKEIEKIMLILGIKYKV
jgi:NAD(P)-dependent dehydrogenase (short-subunit alcohol dehydrogenase family)